MIKELELDLNKWNCGRNGKTSFGRGMTCLENLEGYQCCLGQFINQIDSNIDIVDRGYPSSCKTEIDKLAIKRKQNAHNIYYSDTKFSRKCFIINDDENTTVKEKIELLKNTCKKEGIKLKVKNNKLFRKNRLINKQLLKNELYKNYGEYKYSENEIDKTNFLKDKTFWKIYCNKRGWKQTKRFLKKLIKEIGNE